MKSSHTSHIISSQVPYIISSMCNTHIHRQGHHHSLVHHYISKVHIISTHSNSHQIYYTIV